MKNKKHAKNLAVKLICAIMAFMMCALCFTSCKKTEEPPTPPIATTTPSVPENSITLVSEGKANVRIVYETMGGSGIIDAVSTLKNVLSKLGNVNKISTVADLVADQDDEALEIVIGNTEHSASKEAMSALAPNSYSVTISGNKIVVVANNMCLYSLAVDELVGAIAASDGTVTLAKDFSKTSESYSVLSLAADEESDYTIVYAADDADAQAQALALRNALFAIGVTVSVSDDSKNESGKEVLIGETNRRLSKQSKAYYLNSYTACDENGNLAITGNLKVGTESIIQYIEKLSHVGSKIDIPQVVLGIDTPEGYGNAPEYKGSGTITLWENYEESKSYFIQAVDATKSDYNDYAKTLVEAGFELYDKNKTNDSLFSTYTDGYNIVDLSYVEYDNIKYHNNLFDDGELITYINIAINSTDHSSLPPLEAEGEKITTIQLTMINSQCAYLIRLEDGQFVFVDGGIETYAERDNIELIYEQLVAQNVREGKPVVAAWVISHPHADHLTGFLRTMQRYGDKFDVKRVIFNFPGEQLNSQEIYGDGAAGVVRWSGVVYKELVNAFPDIEVTIAHIGQRFVYSGLTIEILWTIENFYGYDNYVENCVSMIFALNTDNGRMIFTGDQQPNMCLVALGIWQDDLQADIVQYAHHGKSGGHVDFYDRINAKYGLWTQDLEYVLENNLYNRPTYNGVDPNAPTTVLIMSQKDSVLILKPGMTKEEIDKFAHFED